MHFFRLVIVFAFLFFQNTLLPQKKPVLLMNKTVHLGGGEKIDNAALAFQEGRITLMADATRIRLDMSAFDVKEVQGGHIYAATIVSDTSHFSASDVLYSVDLDTEALVIDLSASRLQEGGEATLVITDKPIHAHEKAKVAITTAFVKGKEVQLQETCLTPVK